MKVVAFERSLQGTGASRRLRNTGKTPGIVYGANVDPKLIELDHNALYHALRKEAFHSSILDLEVGGTTEQVLLRDVQYHPFKQLVLHVDFLRVDPNHKIHMKIPLHFVNAEVSPAVKLGSGIVSHVMNEIEISCLPGKLPEFLEIDLSKLELGQSLHAKDVPLPQGVDLVPHVEQENPVIATVSVPAGAVSEEAAAAPAAGEAPAAS
ncbi:50S ribosomal protein L25/general stress protein Ctc [Pandoraea thiooxydans]|uniref:Large ribosomal subunit protein bL25 n=1 Tax=Pandoraea thiooxydans TaxID=445709 RepID=A0A0G3EV29_9BURK|nr:50S ribosomal protein L25/general stress protein Ctc [Pandoraea thiooxydans]AKJ69217.1 50S ribosomal protein L25/general stress protein Ctc [Pandoraea thiooxydans]APR96817.1 50S ribosomal protein L25/general stress protein Ctc [Pandoraea thiooxydans]